MESFFNDNDFDTYIPLPTSITRFSLEKHIYSKFITKHQTNEFVYNTNIITDIIYNEKTHTVAVFKDYLILDDVSEFLKRYYTTVESAIRLPRFLEYYETYSRIFPNYTSLPESKYIYKNIHKKQKMLDQQQNIEQNEKRKYKGIKGDQYDNQVFSTEIYNSIANDSSYMNYLFGLKKNKKKEGNDNSNINTNKGNDMNIIDDSILHIDKIVMLIENIEQKQNEEINKHNNTNSNVNSNNNNGNFSSPKVKQDKPKRPALIINQKHPFPNTHVNIHKHISTLSKDINNMNKSSNYFNDLNIYNDFLLNFDKHTNLSHKSSFFSSSYSNKQNPTSHNSSKTKTNTNFPITNRTLHKTSKDFDRIRLNINYTNTPSCLSNRTSKKTQQGNSEKIKHKLKDILIRNLHYNNNNNHHRNHNCLLNSKGQIFNSKTNNNSISNNTNSSFKNSTIHHTTINKQQLITNNKTKATDYNINSSNNNSNNVISHKVNVTNIHPTRKDNKSSGNFDLNFLKKFISKSISQSKSKSKPKTQNAQYSNNTVYKHQTKLPIKRMNTNNVKENNNKDKISVNNYLKIKGSVINNNNNKGISPNNNNNSHNKVKSNYGIHITKVNNKGDDINKPTKHTKRVNSNQRNESKSNEKKSYQLSARVNPKYKI